MYKVSLQTKLASELFIFICLHYYCALGIGTVFSPLGMRCVEALTKCPFIQLLIALPDALEQCG